MSETLGVTPEELKQVGKRVEDISTQVRSLYTHMKATLDAVTANDSWKSDASEELKKSFENVEKSFETNLAKLEELGPTIRGIGEGYQNQEDENVNTMKERAEWQN